MFSSLRLWTRASKRLGTFKRAKEHGLSDAEARAYSDQIYPPTAADLAYERQLALKNTAQFPWQSMLALLYPLAAMVYFAQTPASKAAIIGYGFANLGYLLFAAGIFVGTFRIFGLMKRWQVLAAAATSFAVGVVLSNID